MKKEHWNIGKRNTQTHSQIKPHKKLERKLWISIEHLKVQEEEGYGQMESELSLINSYESRKGIFNDSSQSSDCVIYGVFIRVISFSWNWIEFTYLESPFYMTLK